MGAWKYQIYLLFAALTREISCSTCTLSTLLTTLNISIQTIDCNNLQNSYVLRILCFWGEGDWLGVCGGGGGGTKHFISFEGGIKYFPTLLGGGAKFYGRILEYPPPPHPPVHILYDRSLKLKFSFVATDILS